MKKTIKNFVMFIIPFSLYISLEVLWDGSSHYSMGIISAFSFLIGGALNNKFGWKMDLLLQCSIITVVITILEAIVGNIDYYFWHLDIWNYSNMYMNYLNGKICLPFCIVWFLLSFVIIFAHDAITYYWMHEGEQPEYWIFGNKVWQMPLRTCHG